MASKSKVPEGLKEMMDALVKQVLASSEKQIAKVVLREWLRTTILNELSHKYMGIVSPMYLNNMIKSFTIHSISEQYVDKIIRIPNWELHLKLADGLVKDTGDTGEEPDYFSNGF